MNPIFKTALLCLALCVCKNTISQTNEQANGFLNKSQVAIYKTQKEMIRQAEQSQAADFKKAIQFQAIAVAYFKSGNFKEAVEYSYHSRIQSVSLLENLSKPTAKYFELSEEEKTFCKPNDKITIEAGQKKLSDSEKNKIAELDVTDTQKLREIELSTYN